MVSVKISVSATHMVSSSISGSQSDGWKVFPGLHCTLECCCWPLRALCLLCMPPLPHLHWFYLSSPSPLLCQGICINVSLPGILLFSSDWFLGFSPQLSVSFLFLHGSDSTLAVFYYCSLGVSSILLITLRCLFFMCIIKASYYRRGDSIISKSPCSNFCIHF